jgi:hypothetical protein
MQSVQLGYSAHMGEPLYFLTVITVLVVLLSVAITQTVKKRRSQD